MEDDLEKLEFYKTATFSIYRNIIFSSIVLSSEDEINELRTGRKKKEIETYLNHFHLSAISLNLDRQREYAFILSQTWRASLNKNFPDKNIAIETKEYPQEIIMFVFEE